MANKITTLIDINTNDQLYPRTKVSAISDADGNGLDALLLYTGDDASSSPAALNADLLDGHASSYFASRCLVVTSSSISSLPANINDANITADHVVINSVLSNPSAQTGDWTVTTVAGTATISGTISGSTTVTLYLIEGRQI